MKSKAGATPGQGQKSREDRLKSALKANMAKRKAQARARSAMETESKAEKGHSGKDDGHG